MASATKHRSILHTLSGPDSARAADSAKTQDPYARERDALLKELHAMARDTGAETGRAVFSARVMAAMAKVRGIASYLRATVRSPTPINLCR